MQDAIRFTIAHSASRVGKSFPDATQLNAGFYSGTTKTVSIQHPQELADILAAMDGDFHKVLILGIPRNEQPTNRLTTRALAVDGESIARTSKDLYQPELSLACIDYDDGEEDYESVWHKLCSLIPELANCWAVVTQSSSAAIYEPEGTLVKTPHKYHIYFAVRGDQKTLKTQLLEKSWEKGFGFYFVSKSGSKEARSTLFDSKVLGEATRLMFESGTLLTHQGWTQKRMNPVVINPEGGILHLESDTQLDLAQVQENKAHALNEAQPLIDKQKKANIHADSERIQRQENCTKEQAVYIAENKQKLREQNFLPRDHVLYAQTGEVFTVGELVEGFKPVSRMVRSPYGDDNWATFDAYVNFDKEGAFQNIYCNWLGTTYRPEQRNLAAPTEKAIISACYKKSALKLAGGINAVAGDLHTTSDVVKNVFLRHLQKKSAPFHQAAKPTRTFATIEHGYQYLQSNVFNALVQAPLGSGKTQLIAAPLVRSALENGQKVISLTVLRSLTRQNATNMALGHYQDANADKRQGISATVHSLAGDKIKALKDNMLKQPGLIIVDEGAMVAALTLNTDSILSGSEKKATLDFLRSASTSGSRIIFLDADVTPMLRQLVYLIAPSAELIKITGQQYAPPKLNLIVEQSILAESGSKPKNTNGLGMAIAAALADGKKVAVACLTKAEAQAIHEAYGANTKSIVLHSENTGEPEQAELLADPEQYSEQYDLITYSPVLGAGFSVAGHERTLFASFSYATLHPTGMMQIVRRFRRAAGGVINIGIDPSLQKPQRRYVGAEYAVNEVIEDAGVHAFDCPFVAGAVIAYQTEQLAASNPFHAFVGHALNQGFDVDFTYPVSLAGTDEKIAAKQAVKEAAIQSIMDVQTPDAIEYERLKAAPATNETSAPVKRFEIETALCVGVGEHDLLTEEVVDAALNQRLIERTDKAALLAAVEQGAIFTEAPDATLSFAFRTHTQKQVELMQEVVSMITDNAGVIRITGSDAIRVADAMRGKIRHFHNLLNAPKRQKLSKSVHTSWLRGLLGSWGFASVHKERISNGLHGADQYQYTYKIDALLALFAARKASIYMDTKKGLKAA